ncbi:AIPR family protein [Sorangium sp. So ce131]|uniref:AIPR family protein n=1 Tax=Sorangium sp. So ce131 TaxID=3133282 RepID=UPI003F5EDB7E
MGVTKQALEQAFVDLRGKYGGVKEDYFALLYLAEEVGKPPDRVAHQVAFGNNDFGIDAYHFDRERRNLYLYQFKWSEDYQLFKGSLARLAGAGMDRVFGNPHQVNDQNEMLLQLKMCLHENQAIVDRVLIYFVFNGDPEKAEGSAVLTAMREDLEKKKYLVDNYFSGRDVTLSFQFLSNETRRKRPQVIKKTHRYTIDFPSFVEAQAEDGQLMHVGFVSLLDLHTMHTEMGQRLFEKNIRAGLEGERPVNRSIRAALERIIKGDTLPSEFVFNHNGVALYAERFEPDGGRATITEPRVLNGAQTITSIERFFDENEKNRLLAQHRDRLGLVRVLAKVVSRCDEDFVTTVTINTNRQNAVEPWNLRASDRIQLEFQDKFRDELSIFYERQENAFEALTDEDLHEMGIDQYKAIKIRPLAQTFLAAQGEIDRMSRLPEVFEQEQLYRAAFKESYLRTDARRILLAYKIHFRLGRIIREIVEKGASKYAYLGRARNLVWALLIQAILNDSKNDRLMENYGTRLVAEADFVEHLRTLASTRVRLIFSEAFKEQRYQELIADEKYSFLRTKATFQRCMEAADDKYGWKKQPL